MNAVNVIQQKQWIHTASAVNGSARFRGRIINLCAVTNRASPADPAFIVISFRKPCGKLWRGCIRDAEGEYFSGHIFGGRVRIFPTEDPAVLKIFEPETRPAHG